MRSGRVSGSTQPIMSNMEADPEVKADVDRMILDYLTCVAINQTLSVAENANETADSNESEEADWLIDAVGAFRSILPEKSLHRDLDIKLRILAVAHQIRHYMPTQEHRSREGCSPLSAIGIEFMELCATAVHKVSETRWFETGAQFVAQAVIEEKYEGGTPTPSESLSQMCTWAPNDPVRNSKWIQILQRCTNELPEHSNVSLARSDIDHKFPFEKFRSGVLVFLFDLISTLDSPLLIELERGQVGNLTRNETQCLRERIGLR
ncbi:hypothetical protein N7448_010235 [Penicillium atrosanguineum]|uniref:Uncharacterized protein n=1 Tax=Penicillium atrosanguineum TaxID=1132637 RepID=A0A9W9GFV6_9EURO|nr:uncharacterized protein N7443_007460 [Penicillium atrosanguineum]KAJ5119566.1 hypothetical protein N7448_010235 [Penicillium atrosanguineum]KAJ5296567.1 hypothetical protein N7443_007460 [Penicillium atrosanguineum]KAJ5299330.1 hypothetical protein N7476_010887 [Penicillium atrosanguineum]